MQSQLGGKCEGICGHGEGLQRAELPCSALEKRAHSDPIRHRFKSQSFRRRLSHFAVRRLGLPPAVPSALGHCLLSECCSFPSSAKLCGQQLCCKGPGKTEDIFLPQRQPAPSLPGP